MLAAAVSLSAVACGESGSGVAGGSDTKWLSEGAGETNAAPLLPFRAGGRSLGLVSDAVLEEDGRRLLRIQLEQLGPAPSSPFRVELLVGEGAEGIELHGSEGARLSRPMLLVPKTVRVGMRWRASAPGQPASEFEVAAREEVDTPFGPGVVWGIEEYAGGSGTPVARLSFLEGVGIHQTDTTTFSPRAIRLEGTAQDDPVAPRLSPSSTTPFVVGPNDYGDNLFLTSVGLVVPAGAQYGTLIVKGLRSCLFGSDGGLCPVETCFDVAATGAGITQSPPLVQAYHRGPGCNQHYVDGREEVTNDASGALVLPSGVHWVPRETSGGMRGGAIAPYADPATGEPQILVYSQDEIAPQSRAPWADYLPDATSYASVNRLLWGQWVVPFLKRAGVTGTHMPSRAWTLSAPGEAKVFFAALGGEHMLFHSQLDGDALTPIEPVTSLLGALSATASEAGQSLLVASPGGRIDRVVYDGDGSLFRESLARVELAKNELLVAAVDMAPLSPEHLLVATWRAAPPENTDVQGNLGTVSFFQIAKQDPVRWDWPLGAGIVAMQRAQDVLVCWPRSTEPLLRDGWTLGGIPAQQVLEAKSGSCALIVRDVDADPALGGRSLVDLPQDDGLAMYGRLRYDVEGPVPGVGRMRIAPEAISSDGLATTNGVVSMAPLADGGYASTHRILGPGALPLGLPAVSSRQEAGVPDLAGAGMWVVADSVVQLVGPEPREVELGSSANDTNARFADPEGGLVLQVAAGWRHVAAEGTVTPLADPPTAGMVWSVKRRSGELCGVVGEELVCVDGVSGAETARDVESPFVSIVGLLADDSLLVRVQSESFVFSTRRWMPGNATEHWDDRLVHSFTPALDGTIWCVLHVEGADYEPGRCHPDGFEPVDLASILFTRSWMAANYFKDIYRVIQGRDELWVESFGCLNGCYSQWNRIPWP